MIPNSNTILMSIVAPSFLSTVKDSSSPKTQIEWKKLLTKIAFWLVAEIVLNLVGIDDLADYSEFIFETNVAGVEVGSIIVASNSSGRQEKLWGNNLRSPKINND